MKLDVLLKSRKSKEYDTRRSTGKMSNYRSNLTLDVNCTCLMSNYMYLKLHFIYVIINDKCQRF